MKFILVGSILFISVVCCANTQPRSLATDKRLRVVAYNAQQIVTIHAQHLVATSIQFDAAEKILGVYMGDQVAWTYAVNESTPYLLFVKPTLPDTKTNMTVITDQHIYHFQLQASPAIDNDKKATTFNVQFTYPIAQQRAALKKIAQQQRITNEQVSPHALPPEQWNWAYSFIGARQLAPIRAFDDGHFTYLQFADNTPLPAIFRVDADGKEALMNTHMRGKYVVIERVAPRFVLRYAQLAVCLLNQGGNAGDK